MPRIAIGVQYDGRGFQGWQSQVHGQTVQDVLQKALSQFATVPMHVQCAGRTDTGVHALEQIAHFDIGFERDIHAWVRGTNTFLPETVAVRWAREVTPEFHARFDAYRRTYHYVIYNHPTRSPIWAGRAGWYHKPLDVNKMHAAAQALVGEHDFSAFRASECQANSPIKTLYQIKVERFGDCIVLSISANAFLHHMVRNIVGSLIYIGSGKQPQEWLNFLLQQKNRALSAPTFSSAGLYLSAIHYPEHYDLPAPRDDCLQALGLKY